MDQDQPTPRVPRPSTPRALEKAAARVERERAEREAYVAAIKANTAAAPPISDEVVELLVLNNFPLAKRASK